VKVVTSTSDLAFFAREVGGRLVEVEAIAQPTADVHFVEVRPSHMVKMRRADVALKVGMELDPWMDQIIGGSRNSRLVVVTCSKYIKPLEVPDFEVDARHGDLHRFGNPHYWLTPHNVKPITDAIVEGLTRVDPDHAKEYENNQERYLDRLEAGLKDVAGLVEQLRNLEIVTYHNSWPYLNEFAGLRAAGFVEPYPGVPPSPTHIKKLAELIRERRIRIIGVEPYFDRRVPEKLADETGAKVVTLYPSVGGKSPDETYLESLVGNLEALLEALQ
jgi:ABC-type Zn uptake system ZnuABC Zn-binding protein ZnuA